MNIRKLLSMLIILTLAVSFSGVSYADEEAADADTEAVAAEEAVTGEEPGEPEAADTDSDVTEETKTPEPSTEPAAESVEETEEDVEDTGEFSVERVDQVIELEKKKYDGIVGETCILNATAQGKITFHSSDKKIVKIGKKTGKMEYLKKGKVIITIKAASTKGYAAAKRQIKVKSYPKTLKKTTLKIDSLGKTRVSLSWSKVKYATAYRLIKYNRATKRYDLVALYDSSVRSARITRNAGKYAIRPIAVVHGKTIIAKEVEPVKIKSPAKKAKTYTEATNIREYTPDNLELVAEIRGVQGAHVPQSLSFTGNRYVISFVNAKGKNGHLVSYDRNGNLIKEGPYVDIGHANGATYNPNTKKIYTVKTHTNVLSNVCTTLSPNTFDITGSFELPKVTSGIAYDESNNRYYLSKGNEIYVTDSKFRVKKTIRKTIRSYHAQDIGAYNGVALVCTWVSGNTSYVDLYRVSDGAYLGSYTFFFNEIESVVVDDGYLVVIMNHIGDNKDFLYRTKKRITLN